VFHNLSYILIEEPQPRLVYLCLGFFYLLKNELRNNWSTKNSIDFYYWITILNVVETIYIWLGLHYDENLATSAQSRDLLRTSTCFYLDATSLHANTVPGRMIPVLPTILPVSLGGILFWLMKGLGWRQTAYMTFRLCRTVINNTPVF